MHMKQSLAAIFLMLAVATSLAQPAQEEISFGPYFFGYETEPSMDYGGRMILSMHRAISDAGHLFTADMPALAAVYEVPLAIFISTLQHEIFGHGSRAREYNLDPSYGFGLDFSAYTTIDKDPGSNEEMIYISTGGTEADMVLARRILIDLCQPGGSKASAIPLMFFAKTDLSIYIFSTATPRDKNPRDDDDNSFVDQFDSGNDIAIYLVSRQARRLGGDPVDVWNRDYTIDFTEEELDETYDQAQSVALWNVLDPMMWASMFFYVKDHILEGKVVARPPVLPVGDGFGFTVATRGAIGPQSVSRFLDFYFVTPIGVINAYGRDLRSTEETTMGFGGGFHRVTLGPFVSLSIMGDHWENPDSVEEFYDGSSWNASAELEVFWGSTIGTSLKVGSKSDGYLPGTPTDSGTYIGAGMSVSF